MTEDTPDEKTLKLLNNTIAEVTAEMEGMRPNTAIAKLIVLNNHPDRSEGCAACRRGAADPDARADCPAHLRGDVEQARSRRIPVRRAVAGGRQNATWAHDTVTAVGADQGQGARQARSAGRHRSGRSRSRRWPPSPTVLAARSRAKVIVKAPKIVSIVPAE